MAERIQRGGWYLAWCLLRIAMGWRNDRQMWSLDHAWYRPGSPAYDAGLSAVLATCRNRSLVRVEADTGERRCLAETRGLAQWNPVRCGSHGVELSQDGRLAVVESKNRNKPRECAIGGRYARPPAVGTTRHRILLAATRNDEGLKVFRIPTVYLEPSAPDVGNSMMLK